MAKFYLCSQGPFFCNLPSLVHNTACHMDKASEVTCGIYIAIPPPTYACEHDLTMCYIIVLTDTSVSCTYMVILCEIDCKVVSILYLYL